MFTDSEFIHELTDPWAPHPVVNRHVMNGGGDSGNQFNMSTPNVPDYSSYWTKMAGIGDDLVGKGKDLYDWAKATGQSITDLTTMLGKKAWEAAANQEGVSNRLMGDWETTYGPLYKAQANEAQRMIKDLPATEERYAGKYGADAAMAIDQQTAAAKRAAADRGFAPSAIGTGALDSAAGVQRAAATTAAAEAGRMAGRDDTWKRAKEAIDTGSFIPGVASTMAGLATANRNQAANIPMAGASTAAGLYAPSQGYYGAAFPYLNQEFQAKTQGFQNEMGKYGGELSKFNANQNAMAQNGSGGIMDALMPIAGGVAGSFLGPAGAAIGSSVGKAAGGALSKSLFSSGSAATPTIPITARGGKIRRMAHGGLTRGAIDTALPGAGNLVQPHMSPSGGEEVDDVHALLNEGEFVIPERTVDWYGEKFFQNLIAKADKEQDKETVAEPEEGPAPAGIMTQAPMFRSEGART